MPCTPDPYGCEIIRTGRHVELVTTPPGIYPDLHRELMHPTVRRTWRHRGREIPMGAFEFSYLEGVHFSAAIRTHDGQLAGVVQFLSFDPMDGHGEIALAEFDRVQGTGVAVEGVALFIDECFHRFPLRKLYIFLSESSEAAIGSSIGSWFEREGRLTDHVFLDGRHQDVSIGAMTRARFVANMEAQPWLKKLSLDPWRFDETAPDSVSDAPPDVRALVAARLGNGATVDLDDDAVRGLRLAEDLGWDDLALYDLLLSLEVHAGRELPEGLTASVVTVGELVDLVEMLEGQHVAG